MKIKKMTMRGAQSIIISHHIYIKQMILHVNNEQIQRAPTVTYYQPEVTPCRLNFPYPRTSHPLSRAVMVTFATGLNVSLMLWDTLSR